MHQSMQPTQSKFLSQDDTTEMIRILAPMDLPVGFELDVVSHDGQSFTVTIPSGGVKRDQVFLVNKPVGYRSEDLIEAPLGRWKDGLFDCFKYGACHAHLWCALLCRELALGQIMQRFRLDWCGNMTISSENTFLVVCILTICFMIFKSSLDLYIAFHKDENGYYDYNYTDNIYVYVRNGAGLLFTLWFTLGLYRTRRNVRRQYHIPEEDTFHGCEDCLCATFCSFCTVAQIARHTGNYEVYTASCFTKTGLPSHAPHAGPIAV